MNSYSDDRNKFAENVFMALKHDYRIPVSHTEMDRGGELEEFLDCCWDSSRNVEECALHIALEKIKILTSLGKKLEAIEIITRIEMLCPYLLNKKLISEYFAEFLKGKLNLLKDIILSEC